MLYISITMSLTVLYVIYISITKKSHSHLSYVSDCTVCYISVSLTRVSHLSHYVSDCTVCYIYISITKKSHSHLSHYVSDCTVCYISVSLRRVTVIYHTMSLTVLYVCYFVGLFKSCYLTLIQIHVTK